jgi:hypothetical protein
MVNLKNIVKDAVAGVLVCGALSALVILLIGFVYAVFSEAENGQYWPVYLIVGIVVFAIGHRWRNSLW